MVMPRSEVVASCYDLEAMAPEPILERSFRGHKETINAVSFNPTMKQIASG